MYCAGRHNRDIRRHWAGHDVRCHWAAACRCEHDFDGLGTIGRGPSLYEKEGPRPVSRHRPADCSASFAPLDHYRGRNLNRRSGCPDHQRLRSSLAWWVRVFSLPTARGCPRAGAAKFLFAGGSECRLWPVARGFPFAGWLGASSRLRPEVSRCRVAPSPPRPVARDFPLPGGSGPPQVRGPEVPRCRVAPSPPRPVARGFPLPGGSGSLRAEGPQMPVAGWLGVGPLAGGAEFPPCRRLRVFPCARGREEFPIAGGSRKPSYQWPEALPLPVGSGVSPFASGLGFPLRRLPFPVVKKFLRLFARGAQEVCASNFKILWPSTSHPQLTPGCPPGQTFLHRILHSPVHRVGRRGEEGRRVEGPAAGAGGGAGRRRGVRRGVVAWRAARRAARGGGVACGAACGVGNGPDGQPAGDQPRAG